MRAPGFWWRPPGAASTLLAPAALLYGAIAARRLGPPGLAVPVPVICVGNVTVGGAGKTPTAVAVATILRGLGRRPAFLTRGHGGRLAGPVLVDPALHAYPAVGDEALLLARHAPTVVSRDRPAGAALAIAAGADVVVMDDGLQNPSLSKDLGLAVFDSGVGLGNGLPLPAGPLRAPLAAQWPLVDAAILVGDGPEAGAILRAMPPGRPHLTARLVPDPEVAATLVGRRVLAFAGIGRPGKFFDTLRAVGAEIVAARAFPDHHAFSAGEIASLERRAERDGLLPVTTEKDRVRIAAGRFRPVALPVRLLFDDPGAATALLARALVTRPGEAAAGPGA